MSRLAVVTGGTGFVGQHLIAQLRDLGWRVVALHRPGGNADHLVALGAEPREAVLHDADSVSAAMPDEVTTEDAPPSKEVSASASASAIPGSSPDNARN